MQLNAVALLNAVSEPGHVGFVVGKVVLGFFPSTSPSPANHSTNCSMLTQ
jgi:hypothetical protein